MALPPSLTTYPRPLAAGLPQTEFVTFPNRAGLQIAACVDHAQNGLATVPWVVIAPKYGETKKNSLNLAYHLTANGLNVLRFDHTNHVGESEGEMSRYTLPGAVEDILAAFDYLEICHAAPQAGLVAASLAGRLAIRAASLDPRISHLVCLVGVVNVQRTLTIVYHEDVVANFLAGKHWGVNDVLGLPIDFENFLAALVASGMHSFEGTCAELASLRIPVCFLAAEHDAWVQVDESRLAAAQAAQGTFLLLEGAMHEVRENPAVAEQMFNLLVRRCVSQAHGHELLAEALAPPHLDRLLLQNKLERKRLREHRREVETETEFWSQYLDKYEFFENVDAYHHYLNRVGSLLGPFAPGEVVLDAGCGNGLLGVWVVRQLLARLTHPLEPPVVYVGLDLTPAGLAAAHTRQSRASSAMAADLRSSLGFAYARVDLDRLGDSNANVAGGPPLDFAPGSFDKICCSLLLSYLQHPDRLLRRLHSWLRPGGTLVISSMKPFCDLSEIYRDYVAGQPTEPQILSARALLGAAGRIKAREEQGIYTFYTAEELQTMLATAGFHPGEAGSSFGRQASVVRAIK